MAYQRYLEDKYCPKSANLRIIAFNKYLSFIGKPEYRLKVLKCKQANYLDNIPLQWDEYWQSGGTKPHKLVYKINAPGTWLD